MFRYHRPPQPQSDPHDDGGKDRHRLSGPLSGRGYAPPCDRARQPILPAIIVVAQPATVVVAAHRFPNLDVDLVPIFQDLLAVAQNYYELTGSHLQVYGDLGELYGAITHGLKLHRNYAQGSDGKIGNHFVEVKTITPFKSNDTITLNLKRNFSKVLIVKIDSDFEVQGKLIDRKALPKVKGNSLKLSWADVVS